METNDKNLGDKKWNNEQELNEGFSSQNLPENYNEENQLMHPEIETDQFGNESEVKRARFPHQNDEKFIFDAPDNSAPTRGPARPAATTAAPPQPAAPNAGMRRRRRIRRVRLAAPRSPRDAHPTTPGGAASRTLRKLHTLCRYHSIDLAMPSWKLTCGS